MILFIVKYNCIIMRDKVKFLIIYIKIIKLLMFYYFYYLFIKIIIFIIIY